MCTTVDIDHGIPVNCSDYHDQQASCLNVQSFCSAESMQPVNVGAKHGDPGNGTTGNLHAACDTASKLSLPAAHERGPCANVDVQSPNEVGTRPSTAAVRTPVNTWEPSPAHGSPTAIASEHGTNFDNVVVLSHSARSPYSPPRHSSESVDCFPSDDSQRASPTKSWKVAQKLSQASEVLDDPTLCGITLQNIATNAMMPSTPTKRASSVSWRRGVSIIRRCPRHYAKELRYYVVPMIVSWMPVIIISVSVRVQVMSLPRYEAGTMEDARTHREHTLLIGGLRVLGNYMINITLWGSIATLVCSLWAWKAMRPVLLRFGLSTFLLNSVLHTINAVFLERHNLPPLKDTIIMLLHISSVVTGMGLIVYGACKIVGLAVVGRLLFFVLLMNMAIATLYEKNAYAVLGASDGTKAIFIAVVNPVLFEACVAVAARFAARALCHNDPSTSFLPVTLAISIKQILGRFVMATVRSPTLVLALSIANGMFEFVLRITATCRDQVFYKCTLGCCLRGGEMPDAQMQNPRNRQIRASTSMFESMSELVAIWTSVLIVLIFPISKDGKTPPNVSVTLRAGVIQTTIEYLTDTISMTALATFQDIDILEKAKGRMWYWSLPMVPTMAFSSAYFCHAFLPTVMCRVEDSAELLWAACKT